MRKRILFSILATGMTFATYSQNFVQPDFLMGGVGDAKKLFQAYITPWTNMFGTSLSGGWYNSAKPHKLGGFDLTFTLNTAIAPSADKTFDVTTLGLENLTLAAGQPTTSPTIAGKLSNGPILDYKLGNNTIPNLITLPKGAGLPITFMPMAQAGIGLIKGTEINIRYSPPINYGKSGKLDLWGVGAKHSLFQYLPGEKLIPLDISIQGGYTQFRTRADIDFQPANFSYSNEAKALMEDQNMQMTVKVWTVNLLFSTTLPLFNVYGGVGYAGTNANLLMNGYYPIPTAEYFANGSTFNSQNLSKDPIDMTIETKSALRYNVGFRLKFGVITWHADYTYAYYSMISTGLGISFR